MDSGGSVIAQEEEHVTSQGGRDCLTPSEEEIETLAVWVEEHLIYLNAEGVAELAKILQIRRGRLKTSKGLKSKFELERYANLLTGSVVKTLRRE